MTVLSKSSHFRAFTPIFVAIAEPQLPEPTSATFSGIVDLLSALVVCGAAFTRDRIGTGRHLSRFAAPQMARCDRVLTELGGQEMRKAQKKSHA
jgi:hypothetical protein